MPENRSRKPDWLGTAQAFSLVAQLGIQIVLPIVMGVLAGVYLQRRTGAPSWALIGVVLGVFAGLWNGFRMMWRFLAGPGNK